MCRRTDPPHRNSEVAYARMRAESHLLLLRQGTKEHLTSTAQRQRQSPSRMRTHLCSASRCSRLACLLAAYTSTKLPQQSIVRFKSQMGFVGKLSKFATNNARKSNSSIHTRLRERFEGQSMYAAHGAKRGITLPWREDGGIDSSSFSIFHWEHSLQLSSNYYTPELNQK